MSVLSLGLRSLCTSVLSEARSAAGEHAKASLLGDERLPGAESGCLNGAHLRAASLQWTRQVIMQTWLSKTSCMKPSMAQTRRVT